MVVWFACVVDPESYAGGSLATGRVTHAGQVGGETPDEEEHPGPPGWGLGGGLTTPPRKKLTVSKSQKETSGPLFSRRLGMKSDLRIGTWNIRTLFRSGALNKLTDVFVEYKLDILAVQEMRWTGQGVLDRRNCSIYYSCHDKTHQFGTGFVVSKRARDRVMNSSR